MVSRTKLSVLLMLVPLAVLGSGVASLVERVPTLPGTVTQASAGYAGLEAEVRALQEEVDAAEAALQQQQEVAFATTRQRAEAQQRNLENLTGMSAEEMESADEGEFEAKMLGAMGLSMADMEALEGMDDAEAEAYFAGRQVNTEGLQKFADAAPKSSDPARLSRLSQEFGDWQSGYAARVTRGAEEFKALEDRWAQDHAQLSARLDAEMAPRVASVPTVDCGEAGDYQDLIALHAIQLDRARAHAELAPGHLEQGIGFLSTRREVVKADAAFADRFAADAAGLEELAAQSITAQQVALQGVSELLRQTLEINKRVLDRVNRRAELERSRPQSSCG